MSIAGTLRALREASLCTDAWHRLPARYGYPCMFEVLGHQVVVHTDDSRMFHLPVWRVMWLQDLKTHLLLEVFRQSGSALHNHAPILHDISLMHHSRQAFARHERALQIALWEDGHRGSSWTFNGSDAALWSQGPLQRWQHAYLSQHHAQMKRTSVPKDLQKPWDSAWRLLEKHTIVVPNSRHDLLNLQDPL